MRCFTPDNKYLQQIKHLCSICFNMEAEEVDYVFDNNYISTEICYAIEDKNKICCMLFTVPCTMVNDNKNIKGHYIYGACTSPVYRHRGLMHRLIEYALCKRKSIGDNFSVLLPSNKELYNFYGAMGYVPLYKASNRYVNKSELPVLQSKVSYTDNVSIEFMHSLRSTVCGNYTGTILYSYNVLSYAVKYAKECSGGAVQCQYGYIIYAYDDNNCMIVLELMCMPKHLKIMLGVLNSICTSKKLLLRLPIWLKNSNEHFGMINIFDDSINREDMISAYLGLTFD